MSLETIMKLRLKKPSKLDAIGSIIQYLMVDNPNICNDEIIPVIQQTFQMSEDQARINYYDAIEKLLKESINRI